MATYLLIVTQRRYRFKKALEFLKTTYTNDGFLKLWRGNSATLVRVIPYAAFQFTSYEQFKIMLRPKGRNLERLENYINVKYIPSIDLLFCPHGVLIYLNVHSNWEQGFRPFIYTSSSHAFFIKQHFICDILVLNEKPKC